MGWIRTVGIVGIWLMLMTGIIDTILSMMAYHYLKYSKNRILYEKLMLPVGISIILLLFLVFLIILPIFYTSKVSTNIKISLIILYAGSVGFVIWGIRHEYHKYKALVKDASNNSLDSPQRDESYED